ncbi:cutinase-domain-containing protein [Mariannaea sp. PMI_226]|nr:cutinase-domain-containing protein [Mariannaea sp. PMI_226]
MRTSTLALALVATAGSSVLAQSSSNCTEGLYIIVARGTGEAEGTGKFGNISQAIASRIGHSFVEAVDYPASFTDPPYDDSEVDGVKDMREVILDYHKDCPKAKFAVLGYSQGGQVASDVFCGGSGDDFSNVQPLPSDLVTNFFAAIVLFGDPSHVVNTKYDRGTSKKDGIFARKNVTYCEDNYSDLMRSYCDTGDVYCDAGQDSKVHGSYFEKYGNEVVDFVVKQYQSMNGTQSPPPSNTTSSPRTSTTASSTASSTASAVSTPTKAPGNSAGRMVPHLAFIAAVWIGLSAL